MSTEEIRANVKRTMSSLDSGRGRKRRRRGGGMEQVEEAQGPVSIHEYATVAELASVVNVKPAEVISACLSLGIIANINRQLEKEEIELILAEFGHEAEFVAEYGVERILEEEVATEEDFDLEPRAPIVTVMGHVDHGKTTLLDHIRKSRVTESESGGITQHIGAYRVETAKGTIAFLDTPGHEAFTAMRARGARITDLVILVVAANDSVRPQTIEAINHAKAAEVPLVIAINKIDVNGANPDNIRKGLADAGVLVESWGGKVVDVEISAKQGINMDKLLELVALEAELLELKAAPDRTARGTVVESRRDPGKGIVATVLVQDGTLSVGDAFVCGAEFGRVRAMNDEHGRRVKEAGPSTPVEVLGWDGVPMAGDTFVVMKNEAKAKEIASHRAQIARTHQHRLSGQRTSLYSVHERIRAGELQELNIILKADVGGSVEVLRDTLEALTNDEVKVRVIHMGVGLISEADVNLAMASGAIIIGFHTRTDPRAHQLALSEDVDIRLYQVIYDVEKEVKAAMSGLLAPEDVEKPTGSAEVRQVFRISRVGTIAGCMILSGTIHRNDKARVYRGTEVVFTGGLGSLKRHKDDVKEVASGFECGIGLDGFDDLIEGDVIEAFTIEQVARTIT
ncbi:MAG: translation initiation factor IF-2 [Candidatus Eisenbacteria bacterium]